MSDEVDNGLELKAAKTCNYDEFGKMEDFIITDVFDFDHQYAYALVQNKV